jgi:hypothetical protein
MSTLPSEAETALAIQADMIELAFKSFELMRTLASKPEGSTELEFIGGAGRREIVAHPMIQLSKTMTEACLSMTCIPMFE